MAANRELLIKIRYSCVHPDNCQGGSGKVIMREEIERVDGKRTVGDIYKQVQGFIDSDGFYKDSYNSEAYKLISIEITEAVVLGRENIKWQE